MIDKKLKENQKNLKLCDGCSDCCKYIALEIDKPLTNEDCQDYFWHLHHKNVGIYIGWDNKWYLEFKTPCQQLNSKGLCKIYDDRPKLCKQYKQEDCTRYIKTPAEKIYFHTAEELNDYFEKKNKKNKK